MTSTVCPNCTHPHHLPGTECEARIDHGPSRFHACLCLARPGAANACPPLMTCQGGTLGYSDIWYLQQGHSLSSADGVISPEVLTVGPVAVGFPSESAVAAAPAAVPPAADQAALRDRIDTELHGVLNRRLGDGAWTELRTEATVAVLSVLPASTDRAAVLEEAADEAERVAESLRAHHEFERSTGALDVMTELRRMAAETPRAETDATILAELQQHLTDHTPSCNARTDHLMRRAAWALGAPRPAHVGGNAEDCPACEGTNPPYPFICPGPDAAAAQTGCGCPSEDAPEHMFGGENCDCIPFTRQGGTPRYCGPTDTVDMISGWETGSNCPHHKAAAPAQPGKEA